eukprot:6184053-Pleurochrysis_carterae.AAC.1
MPRCATYVTVVGLPKSVGKEVKAVVASDALCKLVVVDFLSASVAENVEVRRKDCLSTEH